METFKCCLLSLTIDDHFLDKHFYSPLFRYKALPNSFFAVFEIYVTGEPLSTSNLCFLSETHEP